MIMQMFNPEQKQFLTQVLSDTVTRIGMPLTIKINEDQELTDQDVNILLEILRIDLRPYQDILIRLQQDRELSKMKIDK